MKILIVNTNREKSPHTLIPIGACCIASAAEAAGHDVQFLDLCFSRHPAAEIGELVSRTQPDVVGFSIRNLDNCDYVSPHSYLPEIREIITACKRACDAKIVIGGPAVSQSPAAVARYMGCEMVVSGEGEKAFPALLKAIVNKDDPADVSGVVVVTGDEVRAHQPVPITDMNELPDPQLSRWLNLRHYAAYEAAFPIQTKRGCMFKCSYCCYPLLEGSAWRLKDPEWVADQAALACASGLRMIDFVDSVFGLPEEHAVACCEAIARKSVNIPLSTLDLNPLACSPDIITAMNAAGFSAVGITAESGSDTMLSSLNKGFDSYYLRHAASNLRKLNARKLWMFMIGGPGETEATVKETVKFIEELPESDLVLVTHGIRVLPGTALRDRLVNEEIIQSDDDLVEPAFYYSPHITPQRAAEIFAASSFPSENIVTLTDCSHHLAPIVQKIAAMLGAHPPYWRNLPFINRTRRVLHV